MSFLNEQKYLSHLSYWFKLNISHVYGAGEFSHLQQLPPNVWRTLPPVRFYGIHFWNGSGLAFLIRQSDPWLIKDWQTLKHKWCLTILAFTKFFHILPVTLFYLSIYLFSFCALFHLCVRDMKSLGLTSDMEVWITFDIATGIGEWNRLLWRQFTYHNLCNCNAIIVSPWLKKKLEFVHKHHSICNAFEPAITSSKVQHLTFLVSLTSTL
jgi:hypothetical protein